tara:strand:- start:408 stop:1175 length:768 start_codon:yes stop_codon:yes gene_type:complete
MIELRNINKSFDDERSFAVSDISLRVEKGQLLGLIGESGSGKTTTLKMINRLKEPSSGTIKVNGGNILHQDAIDLRRSIGYVFQGIGLFPHYTVLENVAAVPSLLKWELSDIHSRCEEVLQMVGLSIGEFGGRYPSQLSGGQQQRVGVARALAASPEVMLMDEPFGALDPITRADLQEEFKRIQQQLNLTVIMVTHDMTEALLMADLIAVMKSGRILQIGSPKELLNHPEHDYVKKLIEMPRRRANRLEELMHTL